MHVARKLLKALVILSALSSVEAGAEAAVGKIEKVGGKQASVKVARAGSSVRLKEGDPLEAGDVLVTDADTAVDIRLEDDTLIRVGVNSSYKLQEDSKLRSLVHHLLSGVVRVLVKPTDRDYKDPTIKFRMDTPEGTIGVRGTEFVVIESAGKTQLKGIDGKVLFGPAASDLSASASNVVTVEGGFESSITSGAAGPAKPQKFDLKNYLSAINNSGPLSGRVAGASNRHVRAATVAAAPVAVAGDTPAASLPGAAVDTAAPAVKAAVKHVKDWQAALVSAAMAGNTADAEKAIKNGAKVNAKFEGRTVLQAALVAPVSEKLKVDMVTYLITQHKADVNVKDDDGNTPLMTVATQGLDLELAEGLVCPGGADLDAVNNDKKTAAVLAKEAGMRDLANYLNSKKAAADALKAASGSIDCQ